MTTTALIALIFCLSFCGVALWANRRLRDHERLPMQWWLTGEVIWSAPRPVALAVIPAFSSIALVGLALLSFNVQPRPGQEGLEMPANIAAGIMLLAVQLFHLWMIEKTIRRKGS